MKIRSMPLAVRKHCIRRGILFQGNLGESRWRGVTLEGVDKVSQTALLSGTQGPPLRGSERHLCETYLHEIIGF